jgi:adenylate cyclase
MIVIILTVTILVVTTISLNNQREELKKAARTTLYMNMEILKYTIKNIMLAGEAPIAVKTMADYKLVPEFSEIDVYRVDGGVAFRDYATLDFVNDYQDEFMFSKTDRVGKKMIENPNFKEAAESGSEVIRELTDSREMEYFFPIRNERECFACHGDASVSGSVRGVAHMRISIQSVYRQIGQSRILFISLFSGAGLLLAIALILLIRGLVVKPILTIGKTVTRFGDGDHSLTVSLKNRDEIGDLAGRINDMFVKVHERLELSKYVSRSTDELVSRGGHEGVGQKKDITVLFSDIRNFTAFSDRHDPEQVITELNRILQTQADIVVSHGGDIDKFVGDEVMAIFNEPYAAVKCAYEMIKSVVDLNKAEGTELYIGIGINSGEVLAGNIGSTQRMEYAVIGDTVNVASRLCDLAKPNMILISETLNARLQKEGRIKSRLIPKQKIKGKKNSMNFYVVTAVH